MAENVLVIVEEPEEVDPVGVREAVALPFESGLLGAVADDAERDVVVLGDCVERFQEEIDVLVLDESASEEHIVALLGERCILDLFGIDAVGNDLDAVAIGADLGEPVGGDARDGDRVLWGAGGELFGDFSERGEAAEVLFPVITPDLVPGRDEGGVCPETRELRGKDGEVREDAGDDDVVFVLSEVASERWNGSGGEVDGLRDGAAIVGVEFGLGGDGSQCESLVGDLFRAVPEVSAIDGDVVALAGEAGADLVDSLFRTAGDEGVNHVTHERHAHYATWRRTAIMVFRCIGSVEMYRR